MPKIKTKKTKFPEGWEVIEPTLDDLNAKMREGMSILSINQSVNSAMYAAAMRLALHACGPHSQIRVYLFVGFSS